MVNKNKKTKLTLILVIVIMLILEKRQSSIGVILTNGTQMRTYLAKLEDCDKENITIQLVKREEDIMAIVYTISLKTKVIGLKQKKRSGDRYYQMFHVDHNIEDHIVVNYSDKERDIVVLVGNNSKGKNKEYTMIDKNNNINIRKQIDSPYYREIVVYKDRFNNNIKCEVH